MSRQLTSLTHQALNAQDTDEIFLALLEIDEVSLSEPIRVVENTEDITLNGNLYVAFDFSINLPEDSAERVPSMSLSIDNVDRSIVEAIRLVSSPPDVTLTIIRYDVGGSHTVEISLPSFKMRNVVFDKSRVTGDLSLESFISEPFPADSFDPIHFPGLFQ